MHQPRRLPFIILHTEVLFSNLHKVLQGPGLVDCDKEPTVDSLGVTASFPLSPEPAIMQSSILRAHLSPPRLPMPPKPALAKDENCKDGGGQ